MIRSSLSPGKPPRRVSAKSRRLAPSRRACVEFCKLRSAGRCELNIRYICIGGATHTHELLLRKQGGSIVNPANCRRTCWACHVYAHAHPAESYAEGWLIRSTDPAAEALRAGGKR